MIAQGIKKAELARRLDIAPPSVERIFKRPASRRWKPHSKALGATWKLLWLDLSPDELREKAETTLDIRQIRLLAERFHISPATFLSNK
jgi:DNA-binding CsgD family transcriptional regulator